MPSDAGRTVDEATLRFLGSVLARQEEVRDVSLFPARRQESLVVSLDETYYPDTIADVRLEIRLYTNGDVHVTYLEDYPGELKTCRWDRHEQDHNSRDHFHPLPDASTTGAEDRDFPDDGTDLLETVVLQWVEEHLGDVWEG